RLVALADITLAVGNLVVSSYSDTLPAEFKELWAELNELYVGYAILKTGIAAIKKARSIITKLQDLVKTLPEDKQLAATKDLAAKSKVTDDFENILNQTPDQLADLRKQIVADTTMAEDAKTSLLNSIDDLIEQKSLQQTTQDLQKELEADDAAKQKKAEQDLKNKPNVEEIKPEPLEVDDATTGGKILLQRPPSGTKGFLLTVTTKDGEIFELKAEVKDGKIEYTDLQGGPVPDAAKPYLSTKVDELGKTLLSPEEQSLLEKTNEIEPPVVIPKTLKTFDELKENIKRRIKELGSVFKLEFTDAELDKIITKGRELNLDDTTIEDFVINASRNENRVENFMDVLKQMDDYTSILKQGYPFLFGDIGKFDKFCEVMKSLLSSWGLPTDSSFLHGSVVRLSDISKIGDIDVAIKVDAETFAKLEAQFKSTATSQKIIDRIGKNGKISGIDMFQTTGPSLTTQFYGEIEKALETTFTDAFKVEKIQISIIKEGGPFDLGPYLKLK
ncbi:MAG: hypothetical protein ACXVNM_12555, partial [Bacteroidia bacterium]